jgi:phosphoribosyl 1,2-cyclic phosphodiesterase
MVDCGFTVKETERRLQRLGHQPEDVTAVLVTHEHSDHIKGVGPFSRKYQLPVYATHGTSHYEGLAKVPELLTVNCHQTLQIADIEVAPVAVPHDAREPCQFLFTCQQKTLGVLTDLGSITSYVSERYAQCDGLMLESNHDPKMLAMGPYPQSLKHRVGGHWGHLSNQQAAQLLSQIELERLQHLVISHISEQNNTEQLARDAIYEVYGEEKPLLFADQVEGIDWLELV